MILFDVHLGHGVVNRVELPFKFISAFAAGTEPQKRKGVIYSDRTAFTTCLKRKARAYHVLLVQKTKVTQYPNNAANQTTNKCTTLQHGRTIDD